MHACSWLAIGTSGIFAAEATEAAKTATIASITPSPLHIVATPFANKPSDTMKISTLKPVAETTETAEKPDIILAINPVESTPTGEIISQIIDMRPTPY